MTSFHREFRTCPKCMNEEEVVLWDRVNVAEDPDLKDRLLRRKLMSHDCANCGETLTNTTPLLYVDPNAKLQVFYSPTVFVLASELAASKIDQLPPMLQEELNRAVGEIDESFQLRLVEDISSLMEKIHLTDCGVDDHVMEILKIALKRHYQTDEQLPLRRIFFLNANEDVMLFQAESEDDGWYSLEMPIDVYREAETTLKEAVPFESTWALINENWALDWLRSNS